MKFGVSELKYISKEIRSFSVQETMAFTAMLHRRQSDFCQIVDEVKLNPRCTRAHWFCNVFCALAFAYAERASGYYLSSYPGDSIQEVAGFMARGEKPKIGRGNCGYRERIFRHVLTRTDFDEHDTAWLCTMISAFVFLVEADLEAKHKGAPPNKRLQRIADRSGSR